MRGVYEQQQGYTKEFKTETIKQITERGYSVADVAERLGTTMHNMYAWLKRYNNLATYS